MTDLSKTILAKSDQLNADDLIAPMTIKVTEVVAAEGKDQPVEIRYEGDNGKPFKPCKTMRRILVRAWGANGNAYVGRSMTVYNDPRVKWGGEEVGGIRISHLSDIDRDLPIPVTITRGQKRVVTIKRLVPQQPQQDGNDPAAVLDAISKANDAARGGSEAFRAWWKSDDGKAAQKHIKGNKEFLAQLKESAAKADADRQEIATNSEESE